MRIQIEPKNAYHLINHGPCNLLTTGDGTLKNVAPINWVMPLEISPPMMLAVVEKGIYTDELIQKSKEFVINVAGENLAEQVMACGKGHGRDFDKFAKTGLTPVASKSVKPPYIKESVAHIECQVVDQHPHGAVTIYVGKVVNAEIEEGMWDGKSIIPSKAKTLHHLSAGTFVISERTVTVAKKPTP